MLSMASNDSGLRLPDLPRPYPHFTEPPRSPSPSPPPSPSPEMKAIQAAVAKFGDKPVALVRPNDF